VAAQTLTVPPALPAPSVDSPQSSLKGIGLSALGYGMFSVQDATVKWLVGSYSVAEVLFVRSLVIMLIAGLIGGPRSITALAHSRQKAALAARAVLILLAWLSYCSAARHLGLAELTTIYFAAPVIVVLLSVWILRERVDAPRWLAVLGGFCGVVLAANPTSGVPPVWAGLALLAAACWGTSVVLVRLISRSESTANQMLVSNLVFALACAVMLLWSWKTPALFDLGLMLGLGVAGGLGQFFLYEGFRFAPASVVAPVEYTGLVWAFVYGYAIWSDVPQPTVFAGAALIVVSSLGLIWFERRRGVGRVPGL
jgi:S-adenosylmethionine uptake transporter